MFERFKRDSEGTATDRVSSTVIFNGHPFRTNGYTDAQIGAYLTPGQA